MRVKISDLILWQWDKSMVTSDVWDDSESSYDGDDEKIICAIVKKYQEHGWNCCCIPPIRISRNVKNFDGNTWLSEKAMEQFANGKWMVWDGFHRVYAARRMGYKTIRVRVW